LNIHISDTAEISWQYFTHMTISHVFMSNTS
jgi:hypothetical protein